MPIRPSPVKVLIVDDMKEIRRLLRKVIDGTEFRVVAEAEDGRQAIERAQATQPDLILLDLSMPRMDGLEALPHLRQVASASRIIVSSGFGEDRMGPLALRQGADAYLEKGMTPAELLRELRKVAGAAAHEGQNECGPQRSPGPQAP